MIENNYQWIYLKGYSFLVNKLNKLFNLKRKYVEEC